MPPKPSKVETSVAVIGAGWAGLTAATLLAEQGIRVTVFEASAQLGGRARNIEWQGHALDNGQHILLGAYSETLRLMRLVGIAPDETLMRLPLRLWVLDELDLKTPALPAPLHLLAGLLQANGLTRGDRLAALKMMLKLKLGRFRIQPDLPLADFLLKHNQSTRLVSLLWEPLCLAALNTPLRKASTQVFLSVLRDSFDRARADSDLLLPRKGLSDLFPAMAATYIKQHAGHVNLNTRVTGLSKTETGFELHSDMGTHIFSHVVAAVAPWQLSPLTQSLEPLRETSELAENMASQPICTVYLQYADTIKLPYPMLGLSGGMTQWVIDRGALFGQHGLMAVVISAEGRHTRLSREALAASVMDELRTAMPEFTDPVWHKVITEKRATFSCLPNLQRPDQKTALRHFYIAGDYTAGEYPSTIEGAVRSGVKCADLLLKSR